MVLQATLKLWTKFMNTKSHGLSILLQIYYPILFFEDKEYIKNSKEYYIEERKYMLQELRNIRNIKVYDTDANFILIRIYKNN